MFSNYTHTCTLHNDFDYDFITLNLSYMFFEYANCKVCQIDHFFFFGGGRGKCITGKAWDFLHLHVLKWWTENHQMWLKFVLNSNNYQTFFLLLHILYCFVNSYFTGISSYKHIMLNYCFDTYVAHKKIVHNFSYN